MRSKSALLASCLIACHASNDARTDTLRAPGRAAEASSAPPAASGVPPRGSALAGSDGARATLTAPAPSAPAVAWPPEPPPAVSSDFCIDVVSVLDEETCYVLPEAPTTELLLYLHGIVPPARVSAQKTNLETIIASASRRAGVAALIPRGRRGLAPRGREDWWGWPTSVASHRKLSPELVASFAEKRRKLEQLVGRRFTRLYVAGSSSGAYFAVALAVNGDLAADGWGILSGGALRAGADLSRLTKAPVYVGYGTHDNVGPAAEALGRRLKQAGLPVRVAAHPVGHGAKEVYLDEALAFFREHPPAGR